ncbi:uncharacterized protein LOC134097275 isoform X2 [Sardina pilchardus]|uniref:uncharacterized protein LOC134097275 isoform X2 n=1 Tax=Sardina pilchardus TaxID=27697 RepID=UPI002E0E359B
MNYSSSDQKMHTSSNVYPECGELSDPQNRASPLSEDGETTQVPTSLSSPNWDDHSCLENHRVKRARVENILQRMVGSPLKQFRDEIAAGHPAPTNAWHSSRGSLPPLDYSQSRGETSCGEDYKTRENPEHLSVHTRHQKDQTTKVQHKNSEEEFPRRETAPGRKVAKNENVSYITNTSSTLRIPDIPVLHNSRGDIQHCLSGEWERNRIKIQNSHTGLDTDELIGLKSELSRAVNLSVDLVFKKMFHSLFKTSVQDPEVGTEHPLLEGSMKYEEATTPNYNLCSQITEPSLPNVQTEALSLVIQKPSSQENPNTFTQVNTSFSELNNPPSQSKQNHLHIDAEVLQRFQDSPSNVLDSLPCQYNTSQSSVDIMSHSWEPIKVTSKGMSNCMSQQAQLVALSQLAFDNLCLPHIKRENQGLVEGNSFLPFNISFENAVARHNVTMTSQKTPPVDEFLF